MPSTIKPRRGTSTPTTGLVQNELAVDTTNKRIYIGNVGGSGDLIGSAPGGSDTYIQFNDGGNYGGDVGLTFNKTTDAVTMLGDLNMNGGSIRSTSTSFSILPATVTTLTIGSAATSTTIGSAGGTTTLNSPTLVGSAATQALYDTVATTMRFARSATDVTIGATSGTTSIRNAILRLGNTTASITTNTTAATNHLTLSPCGKISLTPTTTLVNAGSIPSVTIENTDAATGVVEISGGDLYLGRKTDDDINFTPVRIIFEGATINANDTVLTVEEPTAARTITLPDTTGTVGVMTSATNQQIQFYNSSTKNLVGDAGLTYDSSTDTLSVGVSSTTGIINIRGSGELRFNDSDSSHYVSLRSAAAVASNVTWTLPSADGTSGQTLSTDGSGTLSWSTPSGGGLAWSAKTADATLTAEEGVLANKSSGTLTLTLPTTAALGKVIRVSGMQNTWRIAQNASQKINFGKTSTTVGTGGYLESSNARDAVELVCCVANTEWNVISSIGNITIV